MQAGNPARCIKSMPQRLFHGCDNGAPEGEFHQQIQGDTACPVLAKKIFLFPETPTQHYEQRVPPPLRGAYRDRHGRWARNAVAARSAGDERTASRTVTACGPDAQWPSSRCLTGESIRPVRVQARRAGEVDSSLRNNARSKIIHRVA
ncbi:hypothetical protein [Bradyrhizobium sp. B120]|uniref:hypothetical protein n=1 Tax=Bradyrhizobium sp. B120 TaxID=3410088 RepID=UPI003B97D0DA